MSVHDSFPKTIYTDNPFISHSLSMNESGMHLDFGGIEVPLQWTLGDPERIEFFQQFNERGDKGIIWTRQGHGVGFRLEKTTATTVTPQKDIAFQVSYVLNITGYRYESEAPE